MAVHQFADAGQRLMRLQAVGTGLFAGEGDLFLQPGDTNLEELVQVAGEDQQELQPLQQGIGLIQRLFQHADVELQLRQLAMDVQAAVIQARDRDGRRRRGGVGDHHRRRCDRFTFRQRFGGGFNDGLDHGLSFVYSNFSESFGIHRVFLGGLFLLS
ncbi:hypothetical protein EMIT0P176_10315 [Pseudomonas sp. IT-P176]